jgi:ribosomal protein S18 acetylase RimI-like enzyme
MMVRRKSSKHEDEQGKVGPEEITEADLSDYFEISQLSGIAFSPYGDYRQVLADYLFCDDVTTYVWKKGGHVRGFVQVGLKPTRGDDETVVIADILSVAVRAEDRGRGVGTAMFRRVFDSLASLRSSGRLKEIHLTVAHTNQRAMQFFRRMGFELAEDELGFYAGGQRALRMVRRIEARPSSS